MGSPPGFHQFLRLGTKPRKDVNETVSPIQLRHVYRYQFARQYLRGETVLDGACGAGYGSDILEPLRGYIGIDYADYCIEYANAHYSAPHRRFIQGDIYALQEGILDDASVDAIVSFETLEHVEEPAKVLAAFMRVLRPGGRIVMSIPLNHPDLVYHKRIYSYDDVRELVMPFCEGGEHRLEEFLQLHLSIGKLEASLPRETKGTWLGVLTKAA